MKLLRQLAVLFDRYANAHLVSRAAGQTLYDLGGIRIGNVEMIEMRAGTVMISGWVRCDRIALRLNGQQVSTRPDVPREDVALALGVSPRVGFSLDLRACDTRRLPAAAVISLTGGAAGRGTISQTVRLPSHEPMRRRLALRFALRMLAFAPMVAASLITRNPHVRSRIKHGLGLHPVPGAGVLDLPSRDRTEAVDGLCEQPITIILPVYNAFDLLPEVLERVRTHTDLPWRLVLIEDCSTDPRVRPFLRKWVATHDTPASDQITLIEHETNQGFIQSVNAGLNKAILHGNHVVLLNSDAFVPARWASRLIRPILRDDLIASVTPLSNDAEIFSVPAICQRRTLGQGQGDGMDQVAARLVTPPESCVAPTGVGFCMAMNIAFLRRLPRLDHTFGRGYGEEVDWCQRARALGGRHVCQPALFVEHRGGTSFGKAQKRKLVARNNAIVAQRYPHFDGEVRDFVRTDPLLTARLALAIAWAAGSQRSQQGKPAPTPVFLAHALGGGAQRYLDHRIAAHCAAARTDSGARKMPADASGGASIVLRVGGPIRWQIEVAALDPATGRAATCVSGHTHDFAIVKMLLEPVTHRHLIYSCGVGDPDPVTLPAHLLDLRRPDDRLEVLFHDFFPISPSYTLLDSDGQYRGPVTQGRDATPQGAAHCTRRPDGTVVGLGKWQAAWGGLIRDADDVTVHSHDSRVQVLAAYPDAADRLRLRPHPPLAPIERVRRVARKDRRRVIAVLGNIGVHKGAAVLRDLVDMIGTRRDTASGISLVLIGNIDPAYALPAHVPVHGDYEIAQISALIERYAITDWLIPSIWPETFSYTTHEALATGLPVYAFAIGAQGEAVAAATNGIVIPFRQGGDDGSKRAADVLSTLRSMAPTTTLRNRADTPRYRWEMSA